MRGSNWVTLGLAALISVGWNVAAVAQDAPPADIPVTE